MLSQGELRFEPLEKDKIYYLVKCINIGGLLSNKYNKKKVTFSDQSSKVDRFDDVFVMLAENPIGLFEISEKDTLHRNCLISLFFEDKEESIPLYGTKSLDLSLSYCFNSLGMNKVRTICCAKDTLSIELFKSRNFKQEVRLRQHFYVDGAYQTLIEFGILRSEFL